MPGNGTHHQASVVRERDFPYAHAPIFWPATATLATTHRCATGIDHCLGQEMVKNPLTTWFANPTIETTPNNRFVSNVQITVKEPFGTDGRSGYCDEFGIIREILQNHLS